jgi:hypothetical protein
MGAAFAGAIAQGLLAPGAVGGMVEQFRGYIPPSLDIQQI